MQNKRFMYPLQTVNTVHLIQMLQGEKQQTTTTTTKNKALTITVLAEKKILVTWRSAQVQAACLGASSKWAQGMNSC